MSDVFPALAVVAIVLAAAALLQGYKRNRALRHRLERVRVSVEALEAYDHNLLVHAYERIARLETGGRGPFRVEFRAQNLEDLLIVAVFDGVEDGFYLEAGAFNGYSYSCTYALEGMGWTGVLVEPLPEHAEVARRCRPRSRVVETAIGPPGAPERVTLRSESPGYQHQHELTSHVLEGAPPPDAPPSDNDSTVSVGMTTLDAVLEGHEGPIHAAVLDLEGYELKALRGFDLDRFRPQLMIVEDHTLDDRSELGLHLETRGYEHLGWLSYNRVAVRRDEPAVLERARVLLHRTNTGTDQPGSPPPRA